MKTYDITNEANHLFAFEIDNANLGRRAVVKILKDIPGIKILKEPKNFSWFREEVFCEFEIAGHTFQVWEPFGDNSRYWFGSKEHYPEITIIKEHFVKL